MNIELVIWGFKFVFDGFDQSWLNKIIAEFAGALTPAEHVTEVEHVFSLWNSETRDFGNEFYSEKRHAGGSAGNKLFLDGTVFNARSQEREVTALHSKQPSFVFFADGAMCHSTEQHTILVGGCANSMLLADLIESRLLTAARRLGWLHCHAAAWLKDELAVGAAGDSGYGKTTRLMREIQNGARFLSNDRIFVRLLGDQLQIRGFPIAMNVGAGTIRALGLDLPHFDLPDSKKIRMTPTQVFDRFQPNYNQWYPVCEFITSSLEELQRNLYVEMDECHPHWNLAWNVTPHPSIAGIIERIFTVVSIEKSVSVERVG